MGLVVVLEYGDWVGQPGEVGNIAYQFGARWRLLKSGLAGLWCPFSLKAARLRIDLILLIGIVYNIFMVFIKLLIEPVSGTLRESVKIVEDP